MKNAEVQAFARQLLKDKLAERSAAQQRIFKLMYARNGGRRSVEDADAMPINDVVDAMPFDQLDWAMQQCDNTSSKSAAQPLTPSEPTP